MKAYAPTGEIKWSMNVGNAQYGEVSLIPAIDAENNIYFGGAHGLLSVDPTGSVRWTTNWNPGGSSRVMLAPNGDVVWNRDGLVEVRDPTTGNLKSSFNTLSALLASDSEGNLYLANGYIGLTKTTLAGELLWTYPLFGIGGGVTVDVDGNVYVGDTSGNLYGLSSNGTKMWELDLFQSPPYRSFVTPVIGPNRELFLLDGRSGLVTALVVPEPNRLAPWTCVVAFLIARNARIRKVPGAVLSKVF
jgi:outer membrane protein assembly factor BamB